MAIKCAKIGNRSKDRMDPKNAAAVLKGQRGICCLASGVNIPKADAERIPAKVTELLVESYMKRPSLGAEASDGIYKRANDSVLVNQSPQYPLAVSASAVFILKNKFIYNAAGDNYIFHFVDGVFKDVFTGADSAPLGNLRFSSPKTGDEITFSKGENTFLICTAKFAQAFSTNRLEKELIRATHTTVKGKKTVSEVKCDRWLNALWDDIPNKSDADDYSAVAISIPPKKKSLKALIIGIIIAVVLLVAAFLAVGFFTRKPPQAPKPPQPGSPEVMEPDGPPGSNIERPTGPRGEVAPDPPTRPAQIN